MNNQRHLVLTLVAIGFVLIAGLIGWGAFWWGRQNSAPVAETLPELADLVTPTPLTAPAQPPPLVTNTPTAIPPTTTPRATASPTPTATPTPTPTPIVVITHVNALGRLETTEFAMRTVIDLANEPGNLWERLVGSDQLMLIAEGEVVAGFDFEKIRPADITVDGTRVTIVLPAPEILYSRIDNEKTQVYERQTGLFVAPDLTLEGRARQLAEKALVDWAIERDIFEQANRDGRLQIENLLRSLGFTDIIIEVREPDL